MDKGQMSSSRMFPFYLHQHLAHWPKKQLSPLYPHSSEFGSPLAALTVPSLPATANLLFHFADRFGAATNKNPHLSPTFSVRSTSWPARGVTDAAGYPYSSQLKRCRVRYSSPHIALYQPQPPDWSGTAKPIHLSLWWQHARRTDSAHPTLVQTPAIHFFTLCNENNSQVCGLYFFLFF